MNSHEYEIPTNFDIPADYRKRFVYYADGVRMEIEARPPGHLRMIISGSGEPIERKDAGRHLDWIHEAVERIRVEVGYYESGNH